MKQRQNRSTRTTKIRREIYQGIADSSAKGEPGLLDRLAFDMDARGEYSSRCCSHHRKAVLRQRIVAAMGYRPSDIEEYRPLSGLPVAESVNPAMIIIGDACNSCPSSSHMVTNACQNCVDRNCSHQCPRDAITFSRYGAVIDEQRCVNCGKCTAACRFSAIIKREPPCLTACPADAIQRSGSEPATINEEQCIHCGQCMLSCPFAAPVPVSQLRNVAEVLSSGMEPVALLAPAVHGQFPGSKAQLYMSLKKLGFSGVYEVASGAVDTAQHESGELQEYMQQNKGFLTSSCCPAYTRLVNTQIQDLEPRVSTTLSPLSYASQKARSLYPQKDLVFIGPCFAKKQEACEQKSADYVITIEELGALIVAAEVELEELCPDTGYEPGEVPDWALGFAQAGGVAGAIQRLYGELPKEDQNGSLPKQTDGCTAGQSENPDTLRVRSIQGLNKKQRNLMKAWSRKPELAQTDFLEVMCCQGGCAAGPGVLWERQTN